MGKMLLIAAALGGCVVRDQPKTPPMAPGPSASAPGASDTGAAERDAFAQDLSRGMERLLFVTAPPDSRTLLVSQKPVCNELTLAQFADFVNAPGKGLRDRGFARVSCYPETDFWFDIPPRGHEIHLEIPGGWLCTVSAGGKRRAVLCARDVARCEAYGGPCERVAIAYCSTFRDEEGDDVAMCFSTAEGCVMFGEIGKAPHTPCKATR